MQLRRVLPGKAASLPASLTVLLAVSLLLSAAPLRAASCAGDCDGDGRVTIDELILLVNISSAVIGLDHCPGGDSNGDGEITIDELVVAVGYALTGCPGPPARLSGQVRYYGDGVAVPAVVLSLSPGGATTSTDINGAFVILAASGGARTLQPDKTGGAGDAITALDASIALQAAQGLISIGFAQHLACDVNGDTFVTATDASLILEYAARLRTTFPASQRCGWDWLFIPASTQMSTDPDVETCTQGDFSYAPLGTDQDGQDFTAILIGDCSGNWTAE